MEPSLKEIGLNLVVYHRIQPVITRIYDKFKGFIIPREIIARGSQKLKDLVEPYFAEWSLEELQTYSSWQDSVIVKKLRAAKRQGLIHNATEVKANGVLTAEEYEQFVQFGVSTVGLKKAAMDQAISSKFQEIVLEINKEIENIFMNPLALDY